LAAAAVRLAAEATPGVETVDGMWYRRTIEIGGEGGWLGVRPLADVSALELTLTIQPWAR
jgi:hypothetical protein